MESSPQQPRQRSRRSERYEAPQPPVPQQAAPQIPLPRALQQPVQARPVQPSPPQQPMPSGWVKPPQRPYVPAPPPIRQTPVPPQRPVQPRSAQQAQPYAQQPYGQAAPQPIRRTRMLDEPSQPPDTYPETQEKPRMPRWMIAALTGMFLLVMALITASALMQAYLKTEADKREAAYQAMLDHYHVLDGNDGTMSVTHQHLIEYYAAEYNLQPAFVTAIIRNESSFRTNAESNVGARGLMQLMPDTAAWIARKLDLDQFHFDMMWNAEDNIRFGCWYLGYLSRLFRGDPVAVIAAYHAGQTTVAGWLSDRTMSPDGITLPLENLRDGPTRTYAGRVTQAYGIYQALLYPDQPLHAVQSAVQSAPAPDGRDSILDFHIER